jgi:hypothetical protein
MVKKKKFNLKEHQQYIQFLEKRLASKNYKANVTEEEHQKTKAKYDKAKLILKLHSNE